MHSDNHGEESRISANTNLLALSERLAALTDQMRSEQNVLVRLVEQQVDLKPALQRFADSAMASRGGDDSRGHLRSIENYLARMSEELTQGRGELVSSSLMRACSACMASSV